MKALLAFTKEHIVDHVLVTFLAIGWICLLLVVSFGVSFLNPLARSISNFSMTDIFFDISNSRENKETSDLITLVDMTDVFERGRLADMIDEIDSLQPAVLGVDIVFDGLRDDSVGNARLVEVAATTSRPTIWAKKMAGWSEEGGMFMKSHHSFFTDFLDVDEGFTNVQRDTNGGTVRHFGVIRKTNETWEYSLPAMVVKEFSEEEPAKDEHQNCAINFNAVNFPVVPCDSIAEYADLIRGHIVLLGATNDPRDMHYTPLGRIPGIYILAYTVKTMAEHLSPTELPEWIVAILTLIAIFITQILQSYAFHRTTKHRMGIVKCWGYMGFTASIIFFTAVIVLVGVSFMMYMHDNVNLNVKWAIMGIALLGMSRQWYSILINVLGDVFKLKIVNRSLYRYPSIRNSQ